MRSSVQYRYAPRWGEHPRSGNYGLLSHRCALPSTHSRGQATVGGRHNSTVTSYTQCAFTTSEWAALAAGTLIAVLAS